MTTPQQNIWNLHKYYEDTAIGNISGMITFRQNTTSDLPMALNHAINQLIKNADAFRVRLSIDGGEVKQCISEYTNQTIPVLKYRSKTDAEVEKLLQLEAVRPFDLLNGPLYRFFIVENPDSYSVFMVIHHIICDGWSANLTANLIAEYVHEFESGEVATDELPSYTQVVKNELTYRQGHRYERDFAYWDEWASGFGETAYVKPKMQRNDSIRSERYTQLLSKEETERIIQFCTKRSISADTLYKSVFAIYLFRINNIPMTVIGTPVINRDGAAAKQTPGMFVSTMPLCIHVNDSMRVQEVLNQCVDASKEMYRHCKYPFSELQELVKTHHSDVSLLFDVMISYENSSINSKDIKAVKWFFQGFSENALTVHIGDRDDDGRMELLYDFQIELFRTLTEVELLSKRIHHILNQIMEDDSQLVSELSIIPTEEYNRIVYGFNDTVSSYPRNKCLHEMFVEQACKTPHKTAVICDNRPLTYQELDHLSNNLATQLRVDVGEVVALYMHRSEMILVVQLAVLKAGGIFLPIDTTVPTERIEDMLQDCQARYIIISDEERDLSLKNKQISFINIDELQLDRIQSAKVSAAVSATMGAHIIYTSGSTGKPKGSVLTHRGLVNFVYHNLVVAPDSCEYDNSISINTISFDMFMCETIVPLVIGITVHIATEKQQTNQSLFADYVISHNTQILQTTPTRYRILTADKENLGFLNTFKVIVLSGEPFTSDILHEIRANSKAHIYNTCGPSENHIWICGCELYDDDITLGHPIKNTQIYILDEQQRILPIGVPGELCVSGDCIGLGYLHRPELNKEKYVKHPFIENRLLYRTGDLALFRPDGMIEHLGRIDTQVKIRGLRVELGEIESSICEYPGVSNAAVVIIKNNGREYLCAFYQADGPVDEVSLKTALGAHLPNYMLPNLFVRVQSFPMTSSGKIARNTLAKTDISDYTITEEYRAPSSALEAELCSEFERVLKIKPVSCTLDFFAAGGNSIHIIDLLAHLPEEYHLSAKDFFAFPTVEKLAAHINAHIENAYDTLSQLSKGGDNPAIICFPFAGGNDATFWELSVELRSIMPGASVYAIKHANWNEVDFNAAVNEIASIADSAENVLFYSHCAGSAMALKVFENENIAVKDKIRNIVIGANVPPRGVRLYGKWFTPWMLTNDSKLLNILNQAGIAWEDTLPEIQNRLLKQFRVDARSYFMEMAALGGKIETSSPVTIVVSDSDPFTPHIGSVKPRWNRRFNKPVDLRVLQGADHYFHKNRAKELAGIIRNIANTV